ncbi:hypothetical protein FRC17_000554, partial [Serendipita sp. 399]
PFESIVPNVSNPVDWATSAAHEDLALQFLIKQIKWYICRVARVQTAAVESFSPETRSREVVNILRRSEALPRLATDETSMCHPTWDATLDLVLHLARDPLGCTLGDSRTGAIEREVDDERLEDTVRYYLREYLYNDSDHFIEEMTAYALTFPHDAAWAIASLIVAGLGRESEELFKRICSLIGIEPIHLWFPKFKQPPQISLKYAGMTRCLSPIQRKQSSTETGDYRFANFARLNRWDERDIRVYRVSVLTLTGVGPFTERTHPEVGPREEWLIGHLSIGLNVAPGHVKNFFDPPAAALELFRSLEQWVPLLPPDIATDHNMVHKVEAAERDQIQFWKSPDGLRLSSNRVIAPGAATGQIEAGAGLLSTVGGRAIRVNVNSDLTEEIFSGRVPAGILKPCAGPTMSALKHFTGIVNPAMESFTPYDEIPIEVARRFIGGHFDVQSYPFDPSCHTRGISALFLSRSLQVIRPELIISYGDEVTTSFTKDMFVRVCEGVPSSFFHQYDSNQTTFQTVSNSAAVSIRLPAESRTNVRKKSQGIPSIIRYGPNVEDLALLIPQIHYGALKYIPPLRVPRSLMAFLTECRISIAHRLAAVDAAAGVPCAHDRTDRICQLEGLARRVEEVMVRSSLKEKEDTARANLIAQERAYYFLRDLSRRAKGTTSNAGYSVPERDDGLSAHGAPSSSVRQQQYDRIVASEQDRELRSLDPLHLTPRMLPWTHASTKTWFLGLDEGTSTLRSAMAHGLTQHGFERRQAAIQANAQTLGRWQQQKREERLERENRDSCRARTELLERFELLCKALTKETRPQPATWVDTPRSAKCTECNHYVFAIGKNNEHRCSSRDHPITSEVFHAEFRNLFYPHDLFQHEGIADLIPDQISSLIVDHGFCAMSAWDFIADKTLRRHGLSKNRAASILIWTTSTMLQEYKETMAVDQILRHVANGLDYNLVSPADGLWASSVDRSLVPMAKESIQAGRQFLVRFCRYCEHYGIADRRQGNHTCKHVCNCMGSTHSLKVPEHECQQKRTAQLRAKTEYLTYSIGSLWKLP